VRSACLEPDLDILPNGDLTEVGEKVRPARFDFGILSYFSFRLGHLVERWPEAKIKHRKIGL
jgi:hypothetical protein